MNWEPIAVDEIDLTWPSALKHVSASSVKMAVRCPEQWRQRYVLGKKEAPSLAALAGRADHGAVEKSMAQKITTHKDLPIAEVREAFVEILEEEVEKSGGIGEIRQAKEKATIEDYDEERKVGPNVVEAYMRQAAQFVQPVATEEKFSLRVPGVPIDVIGYLDLIAYHPAVGEDDLRIIDRKRKGPRGRKAIEPEWTIQAEVYQLAVPRPHEWHLTFATKTPKVEWGADLTQPVLPRARSERLLMQTVKSIGFYYQMYGPDEPWPTNGKLHPWACGYCAWRPGCIAWSGSAWQ